MDDLKKGIPIITILKRLEKAMLKVPMPLDDWAKIFTIICPEQYDEMQNERAGMTPKRPRKETEQEKRKYIIALQKRTNIVEDISEVQDLEEC